jgi:hypothetical protein
MHNMEIVRTYADHGKSGLGLVRRSGLQQLLKDALASDVDFQAVLVYDVSRWGRFQNPDQGASYEYALTTAQIPIHYCAEQFDNDGSLSSALLKTLKRGMAGEYSRELSVKVWAGQSHLVQLGFRLGGIPGYGLRRHLIDQNMVFKQVLRPGDRKSLQTDRVILVPGPDAEVKVVRNIYQLFTREKRIESDIAQLLNAKRIPWMDGRPWNRRVIREILTNPKYIGSSVYNRKSFKLQKTKVYNPPESWICYPRAFKPLVTEMQFDEARRILSSTRISISNDELIEQLRILHRRAGRLSAPLINASPDMPSARILRTRFGNLRTAYALAGWKSVRNRSIMDTERVVVGQQRALEDTIIEQLTRGGAQVSHQRNTSLFAVEGEYSLCVIVVRCKPTKDAGNRWHVRFRSDLDADITVIARLNEANDSILDYFLLPAGTIKRSYLTLAVHNPLHLEIFRFDNLDFLGELISRTRLEETGDFISLGNRGLKLGAILRLKAINKKQRSSAALLSSKKLIEPMLARFYRKKISKQQDLIRTSKVLSEWRLTLASSFQSLMADEDFRTVLRAEHLLTMPKQPDSCSLHLCQSGLSSMTTSGPKLGSLGVPKNGLTLAQISASLPTDFEMIRREESDVTGICSNAIDLLRTHPVTASSLTLLKRMKPLRQIEIAEQMVSNSLYTASFVRVFMYATKPELLFDGFKERKNRSWSETATQHFAREEGALLRNLRDLDSDAGRESLYLTVLQAWVFRLLQNATIRRYLERKHIAILDVLLSELSA